MIVHLNAATHIYQRTGRARSGFWLRADRRGPGTSRCSACGGSAAEAPGRAGRLRPSNARARCAQGESLRGHEDSAVSRCAGRLR